MALIERVQASPKFSEAQSGSGRGSRGGTRENGLGFINEKSHRRGLSGTEGMRENDGKQCFEKRKAWKREKRGTEPITLQGGYRRGSHRLGLKKSIGEKKLWG